MTDLPTPVEEARRYLGQAEHQLNIGLGILRKKARSDDLHVRDDRVAFDPLDTASGRLGLALGDVIGAIRSIMGDEPHDHRGPLE